MTEKQLSAFLASVRRTRFVDYLDPLGETAQNALERRLSWARVSQHDPAYAEEARFLLENAEELRETLRRELDEDDWVEDTSAGREWGERAAAKPKAPPKQKENERVTQIFQADDLRGSSDEGAPPRPVPAARPKETPRSQPRVAEAPAVSRVQTRAATPAPTDRAGAAAPPAKATPAPAPAPSRGSPQTDLVGFDEGWEDDDDPDHMPTGIMRYEDVTDPALQKALGRGTPAPSPSARPAPAREVLAGAAVGPVRDDEGGWSDEGDTPTPMDDLRTAPSAVTRARRPTPIEAERRPEPAPIESARGAPAPSAVGAVPRIQRSAGGGGEETRSGGRGVVPLLMMGVVVVGGLALLVGGTLVALPFVLGGSGDPVAVVEPAPVPDPVPVVVPDPVPVEPAPVDVEPQPDPATVAAVPDPAPVAPVAPTPPPKPQPEPKPEPKPQPEPKPEPKAQPEPKPQPEPQPVPEPAPVVPDPVPEPVAVAPEPALDPVPEPAPVAPEPAPELVAEAPAPEPAPSAGPDLTGTWGSGSFKLTVVSQNGSRFSGTAAVQLDDGSWFAIDVSGSVDAAGAMSFAGGDSTFKGSVANGAASGTYVLAPGDEAKSFSVFKF